MSRLPNILLLAVTLLVGACNIATPAMYILEGPPSNDAQFTLPDRKTVVFVDDQKNSLTRTQLRSMIGDKVAGDLMENKLVTETIATRDAVAVARKDDSVSKLTAISEIGEKVGAEVVIYVRMGKFELAEPGGTPIPHASAVVKVIDVTNRTRLFPSDPEDPGREVFTQMRELSMDMYNTSPGRRQIEDLTAAELGNRIAKLFYKHEKSELGKGIGVRK